MRASWAYFFVGVVLVFVSVGVVSAQEERMVWQRSSCRVMELTVWQPPPVVAVVTDAGFVYHYGYLRDMMLYYISKDADTAVILEWKDNGRVEEVRTAGLKVLNRRIVPISSLGPSIRVKLAAMRARAIGCLAEFNRKETRWR